MNKGKIDAGILHGRMSMFLLGATLAAGLTISAGLIGRAAVRVTQPNHIFVKGSAAKSVRSDFGVWSGTVSVRAKTLTDGYSKLAGDQEKVSKFLIAQGFVLAEFAFDSIVIVENFQRDAKGHRLPVIEDYLLSRKVTVSSRKVEQLQKTSREFTTLAKNNVLARSHAASFVISDLEKYKMELLKAASRNALERAQVLAQNSNGKVGPLVSARQGVFQITAPASGTTSDSGEYDKSTIVKEIRAVVTLQFKVN